MAPPWIIWCRQRTGSIALFNALHPVTPRPTAESEPFDGSVESRQFSDIAALAPNPRQIALRSVCRAGWCMKHAYDRLPLEFNVQLAEATNSAGYRHVHLTRRDELARLISLGVAENEVTWLADSSLTEAAFEEIKSGKRKMKPLDVGGLVERSSSAHTMWRDIASLLTRCKNIWTEDIVSIDAGKRRKMLAELLKHLEIPQEGVGEVDRLLQHTGQNTFELWRFIPNLDDLRKALEHGQTT